MNEPVPMTLVDITGALRRRRWLIALVFCLALALVVAVVRLLPNVYAANTLILVERPGLQRAYEGVTVVPHLEERLRVANTLLTSQALISKVAVDLGVVPPGSDPAALMQAVDDIRGRLEVKVQGVESLRLSVRGSDPQDVTRLTNALADEFIRETVTNAAQATQGTLALLETEKSALEHQLRDYDDRIRAFKDRYATETPEYLEGYLRRLEVVQTRLDASGRELREANDILQRRQQELAAIPTTLEAETERLSQTVATSRMDELQKELAAALAVYTEKHPEVRRLRREIADLASRPAPPPPPPVTPVVKVPERPNPAHAAAQLAVETARANVKRLEQERRDLSNDIANYQARMERIPKRTQELQVLSRDYEAVKERYRAVLNKVMEVSLSRRVETDRQDDTFRILDRATVPVDPVSPKRGLLLMLGSVAALGVAMVTGVFVDRVLDTSFHRARDAEKALGVPVLAVVPVIGSVQESGL